MHRAPAIERLDPRILFAGFSISGSPSNIYSSASANVPFTAVKLSNGNTLYAYLDSGIVKARIVDPSNIIAVPEFRVTPTGQSVILATIAKLASAADASGNAYLVFPTQDPNFNLNSSLVEIKSDGSMPFTPVQLNSASYSSELFPAITFNSASNRLFTTWLGTTQTVTDRTAFYRVFNTDGTPVSPPTQLHDITPQARHFQKTDSITSLPDGTAIAAYTSQLLSSSNQVTGIELYNRLIRPDGTLASQVTAYQDPTPTLVVLDTPHLVRTPSGLFESLDRQIYDTSGYNFQHSELGLLPLNADGSAKAAPTTYYTSSQGSKTIISDAISIPDASGNPTSTLALIGPDGGDSSAAPFISATQARAFAIDTARNNQVVSNDTLPLQPAPAAGLRAAGTKASDTSAANLGDITILSGVTHTDLSTDFDYALIGLFGTGGGIVISGGKIHRVALVQGFPSASIVSAGVVIARVGELFQVPFKVQLSEASDQAVSVRFFTNDVHADAVLVPNQDYTPVNMTVTLTPGQTTKDVIVECYAGYLASSFSSYSLEARITDPINCNISSHFAAFADIRSIPTLSASFGLISTPPSPSAPGQKIQAQVSIPNSDAPTGKVTAKIFLEPADHPDQLIPLCTSTLTCTTNKTAAAKLNGSIPIGTLPGQYTLVGQLLPAPGSKLTADYLNLSGTFTGSNTLLIANTLSPDGPKVLTVKDPNGTLALITLSGPGSLTLQPNTPPEPDTLVLTGTTDKTKVKFKVLGTQPFLLQDITADAPVGTLDLTNTSIKGNVTIPTLSTGTFGDLKDNHTFTLSAASTQPAKLTFRDVAGTVLTSAQPIASLSVRSWARTDDLNTTNTNSGSNSISAPSLGTLTSKSDFAADLIITSAINSISIFGNETGNISAASLSKLTVTGQLAPPSSTTPPLTPLTLRLTNSLGLALIGSLVNTNILIGTNQSLTSLPTSAAAFTNTTASLGSLLLTGGKSARFANSIIAAPHIGNVLLKNLDTTPSTPFGLASLSIASYSHDKIKITKRTTPGTYDSTNSFSASILA